jgi:hypothetical protein
MFTYPFFFLFLFLIYGVQYFDSVELVQGFSDVMITYAFPIIATILFWIYKSTTPGEILLQAKIIDEKNGQ